MASAVIAAISVGALSISRVQPQTPGYNDVTIFILVSVSGLLLLLADRRITGHAELAAWFVVGLVVWFQLVARWPSAMALVPLAAITVFWTESATHAVPAPYGAAVLAGVAVGALVTQLFLASIPDIVQQYVEKKKSLCFIRLAYCCAAGVIIAFVLARRIAGNLNVVERAARGLAADDLTQRAVVHTGDEIEHLANSFNSMAQKLQDRIEAERNLKEVAPGGGARLYGL